MKAVRSALLASSFAILAVGVYSSLWVAIFDLGEAIYGERQFSRETIHLASGYHHDVEVTCAVPLVYHARPWLRQDWRDGRVVSTLDAFFSPSPRPASWFVASARDGQPNTCGLDPRASDTHD